MESKLSPVSAKAVLKKPKASGGFTLIELVVAMAFFTFMMAFLTIGILQIMRIYQAGVSTRRTQQAARVSMEEITREVRNASAIGVAQENRLCLEGARVVDFTRQNDNLIKTTGGGSCASITNPTQTVIVDGAQNTQFREFTLSAINNANSVAASVKITLAVTTGAGAGEAFCNPGPGSQFCSTTRYTNVVSLRGE